MTSYGRTEKSSYRGRPDRREKGEERKLYIYTQIDGNTVRKPEEEFYIPEEKKIQKRKNVRRNREKALMMSPAFVAFLTMTCITVLAVSVNYLKTQASIRTRMTHIEELESSLEELKDVNEATSSRISVASDINRIYKTATEELGMVYPDDSQVIYYDRTEREYVQQYEDIPRE